MVPVKTAILFGELSPSLLLQRCSWLFEDLPAGMLARLWSSLLGTSRRGGAGGGGGDAAILLRHVASSACFYGGALVLVSALWPLLCHSVRRVATKSQQTCVDVAAALLQMQGGGSGAASAGVAKFMGGLSPPVLDRTRSASSTESLHRVLKEIVSLQRCKPKTFGDRMVSMMQRNLRWAQGRVLGWCLHSVAVSVVMYGLCAAADRCGPLIVIKRCLATTSIGGVGGGPAAAPFSITSFFQFYDACMTLPCRWELCYPWLLQWPMFFYHGLPMACYIPSLCRPTTAAVNCSSVRGLSESQVAELVRAWRWPAYTVWYALSRPLLRAVSAAIRRFTNLLRLQRGNKAAKPKGMHHSVDGDAQTKGECFGAPGLASDEPPENPIPCLAMLQAVWGAALTAVVVSVGGRVQLLDRLPFVGGRGPSYAAAAILFAVIA